MKLRKVLRTVKARKYQVMIYRFADDIHDISAEAENVYTFERHNGIIPRMGWLDYYGDNHVDQVSYDLTDTCVIKVIVNWRKPTKKEKVRSLLREIEDLRRLFAEKTESLVTDVNEELEQEINVVPVRHHTR